jgi:cobalamin biosynthesis protein CbiG
MLHRLPDLLAGLTDQQRLEIELIAQHPAGARFARVLAEQLRGAPQLTEHLGVTAKRQSTSTAKTSAERAAEFRARRRAQNLSNPKE